MTLSDKFKQLLVLQMKSKNNDLLTLRKLLADFKNRGMDKESMLRCMQELRSDCDEKAEDILLGLMDFASGFCNPTLRIF